jgi:hypothetical protein
MKLLPSNNLLLFSSEASMTDPGPGLQTFEFSLSNRVEGLRRQASQLLPWANAAFGVGAIGVGLQILVAAVAALGMLESWQAVGAYSVRVGLVVLELAPTLALLGGMWAACAYLRGVARGEDFGAASLKVLREVGEACIYAGVAAILLAPTIAQWITGAGYIRVVFEPFFVALLGLGAVLAVVARAFEQMMARAGAAEAELRQIV